MIGKFEYVHVAEENQNTDKTDCDEDDVSESLKSIDAMRLCWRKSQIPTRKELPEICDLIRAKFDAEDSEKQDLLAKWTWLYTVAKEYNINVRSRRKRGDED